MKLDAKEYLANYRDNQHADTIKWLTSDVMLAVNADAKLESEQQAIIHHALQTPYITKNMTPVEEQYTRQERAIFLATYINSCR